MASALRHLMMQTRAERGCARCELSTDLVDPAILYYVEEWAGESDLRDQIRSERFRQLIEVMETAAHPPRFIVQRVIVACGFDYVQAALREHQS